VVPAVAVGEADGPYLFPQALVPPVDVEAGAGPLPEWERRRCSVGLPWKKWPKR